MKVKPVNSKMSPRELRLRVARHGFASLTELARHIGCSRPVIYLALERPSRYGRVSAKLDELLAIE